MPYGYPPHGPMQVEMVPQARCAPLRNYSRGAPGGSPSTLPRSQDSQTHMIMVTTPYGYGQSPPDYAQMAQYFASMAAQQQDQVPPGDYGRPAYYPAEPVGYKPPGAALVAKKVVEARPKPTVAARPVAPVLATKAVLPPPLTAPLGRPAAPAMHRAPVVAAAPRPAAAPFPLQPVQVAAPFPPAPGDKALAVPRPPQYVKPAKPVTFGFSSKSFLPSLSDLAAIRA